MSAERPLAGCDHRDFFAEHESQVRAYCRHLPALLKTARGAIITDAEGDTYVDMLSACGALNYGHNHPHLRCAAVDYLLSDGISAGLDFHTEVKLRFMSKFEETILTPRGLRYRMQFPGPTGTNCVEAAIKLARKATGRSSVVAFTNAFHGVSMGSLAATGSASCRASARGLLGGVIRLPYDGYSGAGLAEIARFERMAMDPSGGIEPVAAFLVETVQGEGGLNVASTEWLTGLASAAKRMGALLIVDEVQTGCGRTGPFFSFERAGIVPDIVCLAKSIGGYGLPMSLLLMRPKYDVWSPGEHNGTFRGNSLAFATAAAALDLWTNDFAEGIDRRARVLTEWCHSLSVQHPGRLTAKGLGMMQGLKFVDPSHAARTARLAALDRIVIECCGPHDEVLKIMAPLNIEVELFASTLKRLGHLIDASLGSDEAVPLLERHDAVLDPHDHGSNAIAGPELLHGVADMEFDRLLGDA
ncbi:diaminobutyrate--2-oxoglutarate transaminase [Bradyrhizobium sp. AUGA SZCCT0176]|uniref:diaminobutyrate--2-oxoglutarate transaminase n=1 Tax=Bradyrhizobium sp. AUGA SZCCT0176 TaxID=2807664 RepID=UPI001BA455D2|nr:diaminobutyrate--2-oxoglutarate transaminase [Bradyrhizobium sp. AUGA SZCCT0176]MBR1225195.1 diaminobutyrate--2-oxoglutarate transaminase [Bradyrhizobium sp. AUGA SZCCT0176]